MKSRLEKVSNENEGAEGKTDRVGCVEAACDIIDELLLGGAGMVSQSYRAMRFVSLAAGLYGTS